MLARRFRATRSGVVGRRGATIAASVLFAAIAGGSDGHGADVEFGRYLSSECVTCHGAAKADSTIPIIHGLGETHFIEVIKAYRAKALPNQVMQNVAARLRDDEIAALAAYFATVKKP